MHLEVRTFSIDCAKNYEYRIQFLQVIGGSFFRHIIVDTIKRRGDICLKRYLYRVLLSGLP